jgi:hypothetical protein
MKNIVLVAVLSLAGCYDPYAYPYSYYYQPHAYQGAPQAAADGQLIAQAPPSPLMEEIPPAPYDGAVWCDGYWNWTGVTYVWVGGRYLAPPRAGFYWYPGGYVRRPGGYAFVHGRWAPSGWRHSGAFVHARPFSYRAPVPRGWSWGGGHGGYRGGHQGHGHHGGHRR